MFQAQTLVSSNVAAAAKTGQKRRKNTVYFLLESKMLRNIVFKINHKIKMLQNIS